MSHSVHQSKTPVRHLQVVLGGIMVIIGLSFGMGETANKFHEAMLVQNEPVEMDWHRLTEQGVPESGFIRLVDVDVIEPEYGLLDEDMIEFLDDDLELGGELLNELIKPAKVIPFDADPDQTPAVVVIPAGGMGIDLAYDQLDFSGAITGVVSHRSHGEIVRNLAEIALIAEPTAEIQDDVIRITPVDADVDPDHARNMFLLSGFLFSCGLVLCGSGGPGFWTVWFAPLPAVISLVGYPMRYGRGGLSVRAAYVAIGLGLMLYGYQLLVIDGHFGTAAGDPLYHAFGFASLFAGLAAVLAVPMQITVRSLVTSTEVMPAKQTKRMSWNQACSMEPVIEEVQYEDDVLAPAGAIPLSGLIREKSDALVAASFTKSESLQWQRENSLASAAVQLGCQNMIVSDLESNHETDVIETVLVSILGSGHPVLTVSANSRVKQNCPAVNCVFQKSESSEPVEMLAGHLELVVTEAEERETHVVELEASELQDVVHLGRRYLAVIQGFVNGKSVTVDEKRYGRLAYPPMPIYDETHSIFPKEALA